MSTPCNIGIENSDRSITFVYCHFDGYISRVGEELLAHTRDTIAPIIGAGDMRAIGQPFPITNAPRTVSNVGRFFKATFDSTSYGYYIDRRGKWHVFLTAAKVCLSLASAVRSSRSVQRQVGKW